MLFLEHYGVTDAGRVRDNNEDSLLIGDGRDETLYVVADGIGGFEAGEVASGITIETLGDLAPDESFDDAVQEANRRILDAAREDNKLSGMGTTIVAVRFGGTRSDPVAEIAHVGDSRVYLIRNEALKPVTEDHSLVAELVRNGDLTSDEAQDHPQRNLITRALGAEERIRVDTTVVPVEVGDRFLLCSDGLSDMVPDARISNLVNTDPQSPKETAERLLEAALEAGGSDNITIVIVGVKEQPADAEPTVPVETGVSPDAETQGHEAITPPPDPDGSDKRDTESKASARQRSSRGSSERRKRSGGLGKKIGAWIRALALITVVLLLLSPAYFWAASRYYLAFDSGEVVAYRGLPYAPLGVELNEEWKRPGLKKADVKEPYVDRIQSQRLYSKDQVDSTLRDLGRE